jgi:hypothetical protein
MACGGSRQGAGVLFEMPARILADLGSFKCIKGFIQRFIFIKAMPSNYI